MDAGQITQGLRADAFQQGGQGANFMQMMESGVSFADIMRMITGNNQSMSGIMPYMSDMSTDSQVPLMENAENEQSLFENMQELIGLSAFQNMANVSDMQELKNILSSVDLGNVKDNGDNQDLNIENTSVTKSDLSEVGNIYQLVNNSNKEDIEKFINSLKNNIEDPDVIPALKEQAGSKESNVVQNPDDVQEPEKTPIQSEIQKADNVQNENQSINHNENLNYTDTKNIKKPVEFQNSENAHDVSNIQLPKDDLKGISQKDNQQIPENNKANILEISNVQIPDVQISNAPISNLQIPDVQVTKNEHQIKSDVNEIEKNVQVEKNPFSLVNNLVDGELKSSKEVLSDSQMIEKLESFLYSDNTGIQKTVDIENNINIDSKPTKTNVNDKKVNVLKQNDNLFNVDNLMNAQALHIISEKLGIVNNGNLPQSNSTFIPVTNIQNDNISTDLSDKLADVFSVVSPEIIKASVNESGTVNNENKFVIDLLSALNTDKERKDVFDFSESVVKVDPLQLAGLLDFISTGTGIPQAMDVSDNALFKNIDSANAVEKASGKIIFDPKEMIETGEMEIVSYIPAEKKAQNNAQDSSQENDNFTEKGEKTIDFARTMKSVKENVKPIVDDDETEKSSDVNPALTAEDMNNVAQKVDISFDRAYAELEMNKAKYGSADQQLFKGIAENLKKGRSEFTVKLRPEGLGEILVKLVSDDGGKTILSMIASSEKTAQLLNRDLASLQSSLNEHNVEIENNGVKTVENVNSSTTSFSQYDERRQDEGNQQNQFRHLRNKLGNLSVGNASFDNETEPAISNSVDSVLNITI